MTRSIKMMREALSDKTDEADALIKAGESGDLTPSQSRQWSALMDDESGEIPALTIELAEAVKKENEQKSLAAARLSVQFGNSPFRTDHHTVALPRAPNSATSPTAKTFSRCSPNKTFRWPKIVSVPLAIPTKRQASAI